MDYYLFFRIALLLYIIICEVMCKRLSSNKINSKILDDCQRCKVLTDSFNNWLEKTSRGKYEGGDAAWEEANLKSYSRSEIRLVEIQEGLCSELTLHQDHCYTLAEEAEQSLEKWWFHEDLTSDLYTWLCINTLQHCCPKNHFGELCIPCPLDQNNKVCGGNGKCDGDGTRHGNGTCICKRGFIGPHCGQCAQNFHRSGAGACEECHKACAGCSGNGADACDACNLGWTNISDVCVDINECSEPSTCESGQFCVNIEGSHICKKCDSSCLTCLGTEPSECVSCRPKMVLWRGYCVDEITMKEFITNVFRRVALYIGLSVILCFIFKKSKTLASFTMIIIAVYIYYAEKTSKLSVADVIYKEYILF